jgi:ABC-type dipeptide/oligopeptide/nickel transport system permease component
MIRYILQRLIGVIVIIIGATFITFIIGLIGPGSPFNIGPHTTAADVARANHLYGFDLPWYQQYWNFFTHLLHFDFGKSFSDPNRTVSEQISPTLLVSLQLGVSALCVSIFVGVPLGIVGALRRNTWLDTTVMGSSLFMYSVPTFVTIPIYQLAMVFLTQHNMPALPVTGWDPGVYYKIAPIIILGLVGMGYYARLTRTVMLEALGQDYVRTARSKGLSENKVIFIHTLRNAMLPLITVIGPSLALVVTGAFITETTFNIPGIGSTTILAINNRDWPVVQATTVILALAVATANLATDLIYSVVDPRIRLG